MLHPPYTAWNLSYVAIGAAAAPRLHAGRLARRSAALRSGRDQRPRARRAPRPAVAHGLSDRALVALGIVSLLGARRIGSQACIVVSPLLVPLVLAGGFLVPAYNLELVGGRFHTDAWFALAWGGFPAFTGYFVNALTVRPAGVLVAAGVPAVLSGG